MSKPKTNKKHSTVRLSAVAKAGRRAFPSAPRVRSIPEPEEADPRGREVVLARLARIRATRESVPVMDFLTSAPRERTPFNGIRFQ